VSPWARVLLTWGDVDAYRRLCYRVPAPWREGLIRHLEANILTVEEVRAWLRST
jgi:hypothetical protein